ncbi:hypothetical protein [Streptomyces olivoreticuli]|uniref:hypothetical protein n=1 Tax=Streptomyces olivoreticuli TaxID=68246 RepID=UPI0030B8089F
MVGRAQRLVTSCGFHVAVIDAPGHGDQPRTAHDTAIGIPLTAIDPRITAAVFSQHWPDVLSDSTVRFFTPHFGRAVTSLS